MVNTRCEMFDFDLSIMNEQYVLKDQQRETDVKTAKYERQR